MYKINLKMILKLMTSFCSTLIYSVNEVDKFLFDNFVTVV